MRAPVPQPCLDACGVRFLTSNSSRHALIYNEALATVEAANPGLIVGKSEAEIWTNDAFNTELTRLFVHSIGDRFDSPGLAPGYDYEHFPQMASVPIPPAGPLFVALSGKLFLENMTGVIFPWSSDVLEKGAIEHAQLLFPTKELFAIGVQGPDDLWEGKSVVASTQDRDPALQFLDKVLETKGEKQAMYISFGTVFFPALRPDLIAHLFETLLALERPFVFALASPLASLSEELLATFKASGLGYIAPFVPQIELLRHPAVGGFLSHGGSNSTSEALISKIPTVVRSSLLPTISSFTEQASDRRLKAILSLCGSSGRDWGTSHFWQPGSPTKGSGTNSSRSVIPPSFPFCPSGGSLSLTSTLMNLEVRTGPHNSRPTARGVDIVATPEAVVAEMTAVFTKLFGPEGDVVRRKVDEVSEALKADRREGEARKQMGRLGAVGKVRA